MTRTFENALCCLYAALSFVITLIFDMLITHPKSQQTFLYIQEDITKSKAALNDQDLVSHSSIF